MGRYARKWRRYSKAAGRAGEEKRGGVTRFVPRSREHSKVCGTADGEAASHSRLEPV